MAEMARRIHELGPDLGAGQGGHLPGVESPDRGAGPPTRWPTCSSTATTVTVLTGRRVDTPNTHGTGCSLSAAIAA